MVLFAKTRFFRPFRDSNAGSIVSPALNRWAFAYFIDGLFLFLAQGSRDIVPPVDYSLVPTWVIFVAAFVGLTVLGLLGWLILRKRPEPQPPKLPRERALEALEEIESALETMTPYRFSIRVSDILRRYVTEQFALPVTRQTSVEFLSTLAKSSPFSGDERSLLEDFLNRCDLIKFARYNATTADSRQLLEEARRFVKGSELATV
jgi:hypothetical protein